MPQLSIIIPALGGSDRLELTLVSVLQNRPPQTDVVVVFPGTYDDPYQLRDEVHFVEVQRRATLVDCLRAGCEAAQAPVIHLLAAGVETREGWTDGVLAHFEDERVGAVVPLIREADGTAICGIDYAASGRRRQRVFDAAEVRIHPPIGPELRGAFYRTSALSEVGGLPWQVGPELADLDVALALRQAGYQVRVEPASELQATDPAPGKVGALRQGLYAERLFGGMRRRPAGLAPFPDIPSKSSARPWRRVAL